ncbi:MAG: cupin domain-containing protein [Candidatus Nanopelagicales bacterium]|jgi:mannose-6-phosphate isomerase-like protein (cupin superfamily)
MPRLVAAPVRFPDPRGVVIDEYVGAAATSSSEVSVAVLVSPPDWREPAQTPEFDEITVVLEGRLVVEHDGGQLDVVAGQAVQTFRGERVAYLTGAEGAQYVAVCLPAFTPEGSRREE